jgi:hypothetical protein
MRKKVTVVLVTTVLVTAVIFRTTNDSRVVLNTIQISYSGGDVSFNG